MKKTLILFVFIIFLISFIPAQSFYFELNESINYRFRCFDTDNNYCSSGTQLLVSIEDPEGINSIDNSSMTYNPTYFNHTLPTDKIGDYDVLIVSPSYNGTVSEFTYSVNPLGRVQTTAQGINSAIFLVIIVAFTLVFLGLSFKLTQYPELRVLNLFFIGFTMIFFIYSLHLGYLYMLNLAVFTTDAIRIIYFVASIFIVTGVFVSMVVYFMNITSQFKSEQRSVRNSDGWDGGVSIA